MEAGDSHLHLPCGEVTPTLQDVAYLLGLPLQGQAVGPRVVRRDWLNDLEGRFANFARHPDVPAAQQHPPGGRHPGPHKAWLLQYQVLLLLRV